MVQRLEFSRFATDFGRLVLQPQEELEFVVWFFLKLLISTVDCASLFLQNDRLQLRNRTKRPDEFRDLGDVSGTSVYQVVKHRVL